MNKLERYLKKQSEQDLYKHLKNKGTINKSYWDSIKAKERDKELYLSYLNKLQVPFDTNIKGSIEGNSFETTQIAYNG